MSGLWQPPGGALAQTRGLGNIPPFALFVAARALRPLFPARLLSDVRAAEYTGGDRTGCSKSFNNQRSSGSLSSHLPPPVDERSQCRNFGEASDGACVVSGLLFFKF